MPPKIPTFTTDQVWFTSDTHFGHENIIRFCNRPFSNVQEMNAELIRRWRDTVPEEGIVFHLGDFAHRRSRLWNDILCSLPGRKYLILGNHDMKCIRQGFMSRFELVTQQMTIRVDGQAIILNHNPFLCYGGSYRDVWQLFGHVHSGPASHTGLDHPRLNMLFPLQYDVGVDNNDFRPISFAEVKAKIEAQVAAAKAAAGNKSQ
jgi:calcineurin-like phosphoesterase family protein